MTSAPAALARSDHGAAPGHPGTHADAPAKVGMACFLVTEAVFFSTLIVAYLTYLGVPMEGPTPATALELPIAVLGTVFLLSSSLTIGGAVGALERGRRAGAGIFLFVTILLGVAFLVGTGIEWYRLIVDHGLTIDRNLFGTTYFTLIGFHGGHVTMGIGIMLTFLGLIVAGKLQRRHALAVELFSWYWHFVDVVWVVLLFLVYIVGR